MQITSNLFIVFLAAALVLYYLFPLHSRWMILLAISYAYYMIVNPKAVLYLLFSTGITYLSARMIRERYDKAYTGSVRGILLVGLLADLGTLGFLKYTNFLLETVNGLFRTQIPLLELLLPLGISYYTFSSVGYLLDVYWKRIEAEKNFFRYALFVSFFPQLLQGPISRFRTLAPQLFEGHAFSLHRFKESLMRILWGVFKKMVIADWAGVFVEEIFARPAEYRGLILTGMVLYAIQLYGDFSGGIDVMIGVASLFGVDLDENFRRPYFAVSLSDFWRRWHITLGTWMKDYVMYPLTLSKGMNRLGKVCKKRLGKKKGRLVPICFSNIVVFVLVGVWHGASWSNVFWGLYNGIIIALSNFFAPEFVNLKKKLHIKETSLLFHLFTIIRTFLLVIIGYLFDLVGGAGEMIGMLRDAFTRFTPGRILDISSGKLGTAYTPYALLILFAGCVLVFVISWFQERGTRIRTAMGAWPLPLQFICCLVLLLIIPVLSPMSMARGFIYAQF